MAQFLDKTGLAYFWSKAKAAFAPVSHTHSNYAPKASPTFTGTPKAPTAAVADDSTQIATTAWVREYIDSLDGDGVNY